MSTGEHEEIVSIGGRFKLERDRLGLTQKALAVRLQTTEKTVISYETDATLPKISALLLFHRAGADMLYILTGEKRPVDLAQPSTPAQHLAAEVLTLNISEEDADLVAAMARRLSSQ